jgi:DNA-binding transcriptional ArsR family regulator
MDERISPEVLSVVAHPVCLAVLVALEQRERSALELATALNMPAQTLAGRLAQLTEAGLTQAQSGDHWALRSAAPGWARLADELRRLQDGAR